jgi:hypothetical protein
MMKQSNLFIGIFCLLLLSPTFSYAELYKWIDKNGKIHYSDKAPKKEVKKQVVSIKNNGTGQKEQAVNTKVIIRPYEKTARKLHLLDTVYRWKKESEIEKTTRLGVYNTGKGCTSRGAIKTPDVFINHKDLLPEESTLAYRLSKVINGLDYDSSRTKKYELIKQLKKSGGLSLHSEIIELNINTCAPNIRKSQRLTPVSKLPIGYFSKNRVSLKVLWKLKKNRDQDLVFELTTKGYYNGWHKSSSPYDAIGSAMENAVLALFSDKSFVSKVLVEEDNVEMDIESPQMEAIPAAIGVKFRNLFLELNDTNWKSRANNKNAKGNLMFGEKCAAKNSLNLTDVMNKQKGLLRSRQQIHTAIINKIRPLGYTITPATDDMITSLNASNGYVLKAELVDVTYDTCAPSLSASSKYKNIDSISNRNFSRNRIQVSIKWVLKSNLNRTNLFLTKTRGIAGSLITDTDASKVMPEAIAIAAEQLFADPRFINLLEIKASKPVAIVQPFDKKDIKQPSPIIRPSDQQAHNLFLVSDDKPWKLIRVGSSIGVIAYGNECIPYLKKSWPDSLNKYASMFPDNGEISSTQGKVLKSLDYKYQISDQYNVINMKRKLGGYSLHSEIKNLRYDSCAPAANDEQVMKNKQLSTRSLKRHRVSLEISWKLIAEDNKNIIYQTSTKGMSDSWLLNAPGKKIVRLAIENATKQLFSQQAFINKIIEQPEEKGILDKLFSFGSSDDEAESEVPVQNRYVQQAYAAQVFSELSGIKIQMQEFYLMEGRWPETLEDLGVSETMFQQSKGIEYVHIEGDGSIVAELKSLFGKDKVLKLTPLGDSVGGAFPTGWQCSSNLQKTSLPTTCETL